MAGHGVPNIPLTCPRDMHSTDREAVPSGYPAKERSGPMCIISALFYAVAIIFTVVFVKMYGYAKVGILWGLLILGYLARRHIKRKDLANLLSFVLWGGVVYLIFLWYME
jgi:hypothetical protein